MLKKGTAVKRLPFENWIWLLLSEMKHCTQLGQRKNRVCGASLCLSLQTIFFITVPAGIKSFKSEAFHKAITAARDSWSLLPSGLGIRRLLKTEDELQFIFREGKISLLNKFLKKLVCEIVRWFSSWIFVIEEMITAMHYIFIECT